ncbi:ImmA/IrrE family metallo-endopeptidase [Pedobacter sp. D749]|uniref:ImmA/IrrE family metallo-endopeptidase n=1 Tax=Pedobacter sp. D749 TaxID=2856523 RepID=UPI001C55B0CC|nr:ImmA/IrrE family metallo-endopeptidase [Pedobacter sp. D749]QXU42142.1 ImmA/IrrE family metallo-endopeptidase [Pedobacter sp. D749]
MLNSTSFLPNWTSAPGDTIIDLLNERNISVEAFANRMENSVETVESLIEGQMEITTEISLKLSKVLGSSVDFWMRREFQYREDLIRLKKVAETAWLKLLPIADMVKFGWIQQHVSKSIPALLEYFGVGSITEWQIKYEAEMAQVSFRTSSAFKQQPAAVAAWLRQGEIQSNPIKCVPWSSELFMSSLVEIKKLTKIKDPVEFLPKLAKICANSGVAIAIAKTPSGCQASGVTKFLTKDRALIMLSFRYLTDDHFWFTFFHEAAHLLLHGNRSVFVEEIGKNRMISNEEKEANEFAAETLIPSEKRPQMMKLSVTNKKSIVGFASSLGVSPGIVIGQLQHLGRIEHNRYNYYKRRFTWDNMPTTINP